MTLFQWSDKALRDLENIHSYISADSQVYADRVIGNLIEAAERISRFPSSGRLLPEVDDPSYRELIVGNYRLIYRLSNEDVGIVAVVHARRGPDQLKESLK